jgi:nitrous oxidase accessory protein NosD
MKKLFSGMMLTLLMFGTLALALNVQPAKSSPATIRVPDDYATIQAAINASNSGDTVYVRAGTYQENLVIDKSITLEGESRENTTIEVSGAGSFDGVYITASNVTVEDFNITAINQPDNPTPSLLLFIDGRPAKCSGIVLRNSNLQYDSNGSGGGGGVLDIVGSDGNLVQSNRIVVGSSSDHGIAVILDSNNNIIDDNVISGGYTCIYCDFCQGYNTFSNNLIANQTMYDVFPTVGAVFVAHTSNDIVKGNTFVDNFIGFSAPWGQPSCSVYNNNFINNTYQVSVASDSSIVWENGYPSGGNYWSDYTGTDAFSGAYQNRTGSDGIGDAPYVIDASNIDHYPLMKPWTAHLSGDINGDGTVDLKDLILLVCAYGSTPGCINWDANADLDGDGRVSLTDLVTLATHY